MGMDLSGVGGYFRWTNDGWNETLELGEEFGWVPVGTGPPRGVLKADWQTGPYFGNDGQRFYARDARALAEALERALQAIPVGRPPKRGRAVARCFSPEEAANIRAFSLSVRPAAFACSSGGPPNLAAGGPGSRLWVAHGGSQSSESTRPEYRRSGQCGRIDG